jgi:Family of unknown function (DUF5678)
MSIGQQAAAGSRQPELEWRRDHWSALRPYNGQWVALEGERIVAHGRSLTEVVDEARKQGIATPYVFRVEDLTGDVVVMGL